MFSRSFLTPILIIVAIGAPIVYHEQQRKLAPDPTPLSQWDQSITGATDGNWYPPQDPNSLVSRNLSRRMNSPRPVGIAVETADTVSPIIQAPQQTRLQRRGSIDQISFAGNGLPQPSADTNVYASDNNGSSTVPFNSTLHGTPMINSNSLGFMPSATTLPYNPSLAMQGVPMGVPDFAAAQTFYFPGNEFGPDLSAAPLSYLPVMDFREIFNFQITPSWIQSRWQRISTAPQDIGLSGMRVALVTGPNSWDLQGSLTYYFDHKKTLQRISFRGWTGDPSRLENLVVNEYKFRPQETPLAGFYLGQRWRRQTGGLLMKYAPILDAEQPNQRLGVILEINNPSGSFELSEEFRLLIAGSHTP